MTGTKEHLEAMPLASASFQPAGEEELELLLAPGTVTGFKDVQEVQSGCYQAKLHNGSIVANVLNVSGPNGKFSKTWKTHNQHMYAEDTRRLQCKHMPAGP